MNEKFGDGIMSAISFSTKVDKVTDETGASWAVIELRGKWWVHFSCWNDAASRLGPTLTKSQVAILEVLIE